MEEDGAGPPVHARLEFPGSWGPASMPVACIGGLPLVVVVHLTLRSEAFAGAPVRVSVRGDTVRDRLPERVGAVASVRLEGDTLPYGWRGRVSVRVSVGSPPRHEQKLSFEAEGVR